MYRLHPYKDKRGEWRWRMTARNGKIVADSGEGYRRRRNCLRMIERLFPKAIRDGAVYLLVP